jgi:NOL1/NOP2/fmu family ribosome biogenesis protein
MTYRLHILNKNEKEVIQSLLRKQFGGKITIPGMLVKRGAERIFLFQGSLDEKQIRNLEDWTQIERVGLYFAKIFQDKQGKEHIRLSIEGSQILGNQITENIFELDDELAQKWMQGEELNIKTGKKGFLLMKHKNDFLGTGKASEEKIGNFIPKSRRLKSKSIIN